MSKYTGTYWSASKVLLLCDYIAYFNTLLHTHTYMCSVLKQSRTKSKDLASFLMLLCSSSLINFSNRNFDTNSRCNYQVFRSFFLFCFFHLFFQHFTKYIDESRTHCSLFKSLQSKKKIKISFFTPPPPKDEVFL